MRTGQRPTEIKSALKESWATDSRKAFKPYKECGYNLARGDRRGFVAIDLQEELSAPLVCGVGLKALGIANR